MTLFTAHGDVVVVCMTGVGVMLGRVSWGGPQVTQLDGYVPHGGTLLLILCCDIKY